MQVGAYVSSVAVGTPKDTSTRQDAGRRPHSDMAAGTPLWAIHASRRFCIVTIAIVKSTAFRDGTVQSTSFLLFHSIQEQKSKEAGLYSFFNTAASCGWVFKTNPRSI